MHRQKKNTEKHREKVLHLLAKEQHKPLRRSVLLKRLGVSSDERILFRRIIKEMVRAGEILRVKGGRYLLPKKNELVAGTFRGNRKGFGFVVPFEKEMEDFYIHRENVSTALDGDTVLVQVLEKMGRRAGRAFPGPEGKIVEIVERANKNIVGTLQKNGNLYYVVPDNLAIFNDIYVDPSSLKNASKGDKVVCRLGEWRSKHLNPEGEVVKVIGNSKDFLTEVESIIERYNLPRGFPAAVEEQVSAIASEIPKTEISRRTDYRGHEVFTIDPVRARDFDDAVSLLYNGRKREYTLGVHIADVAYYVGEKTPLDEEAALRGNSYYIANTVIPMLPKKLSDDLCSLKENVPRLTKTVLLTFADDGRMIGYDIHDSIIQSKKRFNYSEALDVIKGRINSPYSKTLRLMADLSEILKQQRQKRGSITFDMPEINVVIGDDGEVADLEKESSDISHSLIEEFMLAANETVALHLTKKNIASIYRVHADPEDAKLENLVQVAHHFGYRLPRNPGHNDIQRLLDRVSGKPIAYIINLAYLKTMKIAEYSIRNIGHFGLASSHYMHFTSPIRRYPDLVVHRCLNELNEKPRTASAAKGIVNMLRKIADSCSSTERKADEAEKALVEIAVLRYLDNFNRSHKAKVFKGLITEVNAIGMKVYLSDFLFEGIVKLSSLVSDYYRINRRKRALEGVRTRRTFSVGNEIAVRIKRIDMLAKELELVPVKS